MITDEFLQQGNEDIRDYLAARTFPGEVMGAMLVYMADNQAAGEDAAIEFLTTQEDVWAQWVPADVADKVRAALGNT